MHWHDRLIVFAGVMIVIMFITGVGLYMYDDSEKTTEVITRYGVIQVVDMDFNPNKNEPVCFLEVIFEETLLERVTQFGENCTNYFVGNEVIETTTNSFTRLFKVKTTSIKFELAK
jgi:hypothetical protein